MSRRSNGASMFIVIRGLREGRTATMDGRKSLIPEPDVRWPLTRRTPCASSASGCSGASTAYEGKATVREAARARSSASRMDVWSTTPELACKPSQSSYRDSRSPSRSSAVRQSHLTIQTRQVILGARPEARMMTRGLKTRR